MVVFQPFRPAPSLVDRENYANEVLHGQGQQGKTSWFGYCIKKEEQKQIVMSHSNIEMAHEEA